MNKESYLKQLENSLSNLSTIERKDIIRDYEEHFLIGLESGKTEEEISRALGSPKQIAKEILSQYHIGKVEEKPSAGNFLKASFAVLGLSFLNLVFVIGPLIGLAGVLFGGWASGIAFVATPFLYIVKIVFEPEGFQFFELFIVIGLMGIGIFVLIGMKFATQFLLKHFVRYLKYNLSIVKGGFSK